MEQLTPKQMAIANVLIERVHERITSDLPDLLIDEAELAEAIGDGAWKRSTNDDLIALSAFCNREGYPLVPLLVVIPGLNKPEKTLMSNAFRATLSPAENTKRWHAAIDDIKAASLDVWKEFQARVQPSED